MAKEKRARRMRITLGSAADRILDTRVVRAGFRYHFGHAALFTGGVTWSALLSITAIVTILINIGRAFLGGRRELLDQVLLWANDLVPGLFDYAGSDGLLDPESFAVETWWNPVTLISLIVLLWTAVSVMTGLRRGLRAMFGLAGTPLPMPLGKLRDLLGFLGIGLAILLSAVLSTIVGFLGRPVLRWLSLDASANAPLLTTAAALGAFALDWLVFIMLMRGVAAAHVPRTDLLLAATLGALITALLRRLGSTVITMVSHPVLASLTAVATLAIMVSLMVRAALFVAAWAANPPRPPLIYPVDAFHHHDRPNYVTRSAAHTLAWPHHPVTGTLIPLDPGTGAVITSDGAVSDDEAMPHL